MPLAVQKSVPPLRPNSLAELLSAIEVRVAESRVHLTVASEAHVAAPEAYVADLVHFLTLLHGELPHVLDGVTSGDPTLAEMLEPAVQQLHRDRAWLTDLSVETGASVDHFGVIEAELAVSGLRDAMLTLASSQRSGCGLGVTIGVLTEWPHIRTLLDRAGTLAFAARWPSPSGSWASATLERVLKIAEGAFATPAGGRAVAFGASQWTQLHGQLLALVEDRAAARALNRLQADRSFA